MNRHGAGCQLLLKYLLLSRIKVAVDSSNHRPEKHSTGTVSHRHILHPSFGCVHLARLHTTHRAEPGTPRLNAASRPASEGKPLDVTKRAERRFRSCAALAWRASSWLSEPLGLYSCIRSVRYVSVFVWRLEASCWHWMEGLVRNTVQMSHPAVDRVPVCCRLK